MRGKVIWREEGEGGGYGWYGRGIREDKGKQGIVWRCG